MGMEGFPFGYGEFRSWTKPTGGMGGDRGRGGTKSPGKV